jgi:hypothetical protein
MLPSVVAQSVPSSSQSPESQVMVEGVMHLPLPLQTPAGVTTPSMHDCGAPHAVPEGAVPDATQTGLPVVQSIVPMGLQSSPVEQGAPELQARQLPPLHT